MTYVDGNFVISVSGGRTSGMLFLKMLERYGNLPERGFACFQNTSKEDERTLEFVKKLEEFSGQKINWLEYRQEEKRKPFFEEVSFETASRKGEVFDNALFFENGVLPNQHIRWCTRRMKFDTLRRFCVSKGWENWSNYVGIRADEAHRAKTSVHGRESKIYPLVDWMVTKNDVLAFWKKMPFDLELPIINGKTRFGNCRGCFLKSEEDIALLKREHPEDFEWWANLERQKGKTFRKKGSYDSIAAAYEKRPETLDLEGYFCQQDEGECTGDMETNVALSLPDAKA